MNKLDELKAILREKYRIKYGTDYTILRKYDKNFVLCLCTYTDFIREVTEQVGVRIDGWFNISNEDLLRQDA